MQKNFKQNKEPLAVLAPISVKLKTPQQPKKPGAAAPSVATTSYFLKPAPEELLQHLSSMKNLNKDVVQDFKLKDSPVLLQEAVVQTTRATLRVTPVAFTEVKGQEIQTKL